jgi:hypothetical protein
MATTKRSNPENDIRRPLKIGYVTVGNSTMLSIPLHNRSEVAQMHELKPCRLAGPTTAIQAFGPLEGLGRRAVSELRQASGCSNENSVSWRYPELAIITKFERMLCTVAKVFLSRLQP